ncbi:MAG TPA: hypothetical protein VFC93_21570 [Chloroflexota bacterium]|nr:hypothetical protein [Chloroflexota bacterium]
MRRPTHRPIGRSAALALLALVPAVASPLPAAAQSAGCAQLVRQAETWVATPEQYMPAPRPGDTSKNEPTTVYAEVDHFDVAMQTDADGAPVAQEEVPVYRAMSLGGVLIRLMHTGGVDPTTVGEAIGAIGDAWATWANGDATKPVPFDAAQQILADAEQRCQAPPNAA